MIAFNEKFQRMVRLFHEQVKSVEEPAKFDAVQEVKTKLVNNTLSQAEGKMAGSPNTPSHVWLSDIPVEVGGENKGPNPLSYFVSSLGLCQQYHYAEYTALMGIKLTSLEIAVKGKYNRLPGSWFNEINWETSIESSETPERIKELVSRAEGSCFVTNTLKRAAKLSGKIMLNGKLLTTTTHSKDS